MVVAITRVVVLTLLAQAPTVPPPHQPVFRGNAPGQMPPVGPPLPAGQQITAHDGDTVFISGDDRIRIVRRCQANARVLFSADDHRIILLVDRVEANGAADGFVDQELVFRDVSGAWPLGDRWEGVATIDQYIPVDRGSSPAGYGITTPAGLVQLLPASGIRSEVFRDNQAIAITFRGESAGGPGRGIRFDDAERMVLSQEDRMAKVTAPRPAAGGAAAVAVPGAPQPVRVGGNIVQPMKIVDVKPAYPPEAQAARVQGVVIIEATIGTDGTVQDAKVLRSIPLLDDAALAAVKQWRFTQTLVNGQPVPVIMTVTVNFALQH